MKICYFAFLALAFTPALGWAVSPHMLAGGQELFTRQWEPQSPALGGDGLGPLFNASSCATCHQQGGIGGAGEAAFNANSIGIDSLEVYGRGVTAGKVTKLVSQFHPGFVGADGNVVNVLTLPHHGGSQTLQRLRSALTETTSAVFDADGGATDAAEVRIANSTPILFEQNVNGLHIRIAARLYSRNTTALFGSGLIDQVADTLLDRQVRLQQQHPEISGRPSTLSTTSRYGKFGWRANVATLMEFNDQACANEMGLQTRRRMQTQDSTTRGYQNKAHDISDEQLQMLNQFVAALPSPKQSLPSNPMATAVVHRGEALFNQVGCNVCHVRDMLPANGLYSDLLLHDMGADSIDLSHAEPYVISRELVTREVGVIPPRPTGFFSEYYGGVSSIVSEGSAGRVIGPAFSFYAPSQPTAQKAFRLIDSQINPDTKNNTVAIQKSVLAMRPTQAIAKIELREQMNLQATKFNQEWRTAPLWGVRDSAPYWHDGRAETLLEAIAMHDGEAAGTRDRFLNSSFEERQSLLAFLESLTAP